MHYETEELGMDSRHGDVSPPRPVGSTQRHIQCFGVSFPGDEVAEALS